MARTIHKSLDGAVREARALSLDYPNIAFKIHRKINYSLVSDEDTGFFDLMDSVWEYYVGEIDNPSLDKHLYTYWNGLRQDGIHTALGLT